MLKIFVTGDNHIGLKYASHEQSARLVAERISAFEGMVETANREECSLFVITGDMFENTYVSKKDVSSVLSRLSAFNGIVAVLPGNHDFYDEDVKVWHHFRDVMASYDNIMLMTDYRPYKITMGEENVILYPALCTSLHSLPGQNNLGWIKNAGIQNDNNTYHIGIAHGAVEGETIDNEGQYFLMKRSELEDIPVDVWLVGHTHVPFPRNLTEDYSIRNDKIFNAGTHVQTDVSCNTEGLCFIIKIDENKTVYAKKSVSGNIRFCRKNIDVTAGQFETILKSELSEIDENTVVDIILKGAITIPEYEDRATIIRNSLSRFIEGTYSDYAISKLISEETIRSEFPETSFSAELLTSLLDEPKEAQLAYELLKSLKEAR